MLPDPVGDQTRDDHQLEGHLTEQTEALTKGRKGTVVKERKEK